MSRLLTHALAPAASGKPLAAARVAELLARIFDAPLDADALSSICESGTIPLERRMATAVQRLCAAGQTADLDECGREFVRLFLDPQGAPCLLWESAWTERPPRLMGRSHGEVLRAYAAAGFQPVRDNEPADHIAFELAFVALLARTGQSQLLESFWREHVLNWMPLVAEKLRQTTRVPLYAAAADLLDTAVRPIRRKSHERKAAESAARVR